MDSEHKYLESLNDDDIIELQPEVVKVLALKDALRKVFSENLDKTISSLVRNGLIKLLRADYQSIPTEKYIKDGITCRVLKVNEGWKNGKIKFTININVDFFPNDS